MTTKVSDVSIAPRFRKNEVSNVQSSLDIVKIKCGEDEKLPKSLKVDPRLPQPPFRLLMIAPSHSGKTNLILNLLTRKDMYLKKFHQVYIFSASINTDKLWDEVKDRLPKDHLFDEYHPEKIAEITRNQQHIISERKRIIDKNERICEREKKRVKNGELKKLPRLTSMKMPRVIGGDKDDDEDDEDDKIEDVPIFQRVLFIFDDMADKQVYSKNQVGEIEKLFMRGRHYNISFIMTSQYYKVVSPIVRMNLSDFIVFKCNNEEVQKIAEEQRGVLDLDEFMEIYHEATEKKYNFLFIGATPSADNNVQFRRGFNDVLKTI